MPLKEFECLSCEKRFDTLIRHKDDLVDVECPYCKKKDVQMCLTFPSNYTISGPNGASTRPKRMGGDS